MRGGKAARSSAAADLVRRPQRHAAALDRDLDLLDRPQLVRAAVGDRVLVLELGRELPPGWFGENLRTEGIDVNAAVIGERWRIGDRVEVEVTMPRTPCQTFARWVGGDDARGWVKRFSDARRLGPYLRVVKTGRVSAGDEIVVLARPEGAPTIIDVYRAPKTAAV